jgi:putative endonuclease
MTNVRNTVLYVGVTNDLIRAYEHKERLVDGFTRKYNIVELAYYEVFEDIENAILREKQIKAGSRQKKVELIQGMNPKWRDLHYGLWDCHGLCPRNDMWSSRENSKKNKGVGENP